MDGDEEALSLGVLGPLVVSRARREVAVGSPMAKQVLATLVARAGEPASVDALVEELWAGTPPASARKSVQIIVSRPRRVVGDSDRLRHRGDTYSLVAGSAEVDALRFAKLVSDGRTVRSSGDPEAARVFLDRTLDLWRGSPYVDVRPGRVTTAAADRLAEERLLALEDRVGLDLELGRHGDLIAELRGHILCCPGTLANLVMDSRPPVAVWGRW